VLSSNTTTAINSRSLDCFSCSTRRALNFLRKKRRLPLEYSQYPTLTVAEAMGVKGLWQLLLPIGRRISIETLEGKVLAIDASIWLTQFIKAMRDPDTGSVRPAAHLIGFFRRLCKLRYHGIRPVFVFDGATPEIKLREIQKRRKRREQLSISANGEDSIQRMAKRILVQQLKKDKNGKMTIAKRTGGGVGGNDVEAKNKNSTAEGEVDEGAENNSTATASSSFAPGFYDPEEERQDEKVQQEKVVETATKSIDTDSHPRDVIEIVEDEDYFEEPPALEQSDWDTAILQPDDEEFDDDEEHDDMNDNERQRPAKRYKQLRRGGSGKQGDEFDADYVASLPPTERKDVVEDAKRRQRLVSRKEFMKVAADPVGLSQCQLRNFLRSTKLNQDIVKMAKRVVDKEEAIGTNASNQSRRIVFEKDGEVQPKNKSAKGESLRVAYGSNDTKRRKLSVMESSDSEEVEWEEAASDRDGGFKKVSMASRSRAIVDADSDSDDEQEQIGGFFLESQKNSSNTNDGIHFMAGDVDKKTLAEAPSNRLVDIEHSDDDDDDDDNRRGGFIATNGLDSPDTKDRNESPTTERSPSRGFTSNDFESDDDEGSGFLPLGRTATSNDARTMQELHDEALAIAMQIDDQSDSADKEDEKGIFASTNKTDEVQIVSKLVSKSRGHLDEEVHHAGGNVVDARCSQDQHDAMLAIAMQKQEDIGREQADEMLARRLQKFEESNAGSDGEESSDSDSEVNVSRKLVAAASASSVTPRTYTELSQELDDKLLARALQESEADMATQVRANQEGEAKSEDLNVKPKAVEQVKKNKAQGHPVMRTLQPAMQETTGVEGEDNEDSDDDVAWEDGEDGADEDTEIETSDLHNEQYPQEVSDEHAPSDSTVPLMARYDLEEDDPWATNDFKPHGASRDDTAAALEQAQATAAKLTDWAGRAFRRAIAVHAEETGTTFTRATESAKKEKEHRVENSFHPVVTIDDPSEDEKKDSDNGTYGDTAPNPQASAPGPPPNEAERIGVLHEGGHGAPVQSKRNGGLKGSAPTSLWPEIIGGGNSGGELDLDTLELYKEQWAEERNQQERDMDTVTDEMRAEAIQLLQLFGVPYVEAPAEAEAQCVALERLGLVDGVVTEDSDAFVFGGKVIYKNIFDDQKFVEVYRSKDAETEMKISHEGMVALAMLIGGDYTEGVKGVGVVNGMEILEAFNVSENGVEAGLKNFRKWLDGFDPMDSVAVVAQGKLPQTREEIFHKNHHTARTRWIAPKHFPDERVLTAYMKPIVDSSNERFSWGIPDLQKLIIFCNRHAGWDADETKKLLEPVVKKLESGSRQTRIDSFMRYEDGIKFAHVQSKRLQSVLNGGKDDKGQQK
jgi:5'-3' exonuclease